MTDLQVRRVRFGFADSDVPFLWNPADPAFSCAANALSFLALGFEKMITATVHEALPLITDPQVRQEAEAFTRQEGQHSMAHRGHVKALIKGYPALKETLDEVMAAYDDLIANKSLDYRLAYTADIEATFTPTFKLMLDNADTLFAPGDDRVASLFLWHFVEEVEHRSSALIIYEALVASSWYRLRVASSVFKHAAAVMATAAKGFNKHVPLADRKVDATSMFGANGSKKSSRRFRLFKGKTSTDVPSHGPYAPVYAEVPERDKWAAALGVVRSQIPGHNPARQKLPALAAEWFARYDAGYDVTRWYTAARGDTV